MIILIGPSASGKTEIAKELNKCYNIKKVITHTTRSPRTNEINDVDYHFIDKETFLKLKEQNYFVETTLYNNNYYGTSKKEISDDKVLIVDQNGKNAFLKLNNKKIIIFYIEANESLREQRMISRGDSLENIKERLIKDKIYFNDKAKENVNYIILNENKSLKEVTDEIYDKYMKSLQAKI